MNFKEKLDMCFYGKHNYIKLWEEYNWLMKNAEQVKPKQIDSLVNLCDNWIRVLKYREGFDFLGRWPWKWICYITGTSNRHANFLSTIELMLNELDKTVDDNANSKINESIGFRSKK